MPLLIMKRLRYMYRTLYLTARMSTTFANAPFDKCHFSSLINNNSWLLPLLVQNISICQKLFCLRHRLCRLHQQQIFGHVINRSRGDWGRRILLAGGEFSRLVVGASHYNGRAPFYVDNESLNVDYFISKNIWLQVSNKWCHQI